jgi:hypothetical protein
MMGSTPLAAESELLALMRIVADPDATKKTLESILAAKQEAVAAERAAVGEQR